MRRAPRWLPILILILVSCSGTGSDAPTTTSPAATALPATTTADDATTTATEGTTTSAASATTVPPAREELLFDEIIAPAGGTDVTLMIGPDGNPVIAYFDWQAVRLLRCTDPICAGVPEIATVTTDAGQMQWKLAAVLPDGNPVFSVGAVTGDPEGGVPFGEGSLYLCDDPICQTGSPIYLGVRPPYGFADSWNDFGSAVFIDPASGLPTVAAADQGALVVLSCLDAACEQLSSEIVAETEDPNGWPRFKDAAMLPGGEIAVLWNGFKRTAPDDSEPLGEFHGTHSMWLTICADARCSTDSINVALGDGSWGVLFAGADGSLVAVTQALPWEDVLVSAVRCADSMCSSIATSTPGFDPTHWVFDPEFPDDEAVYAVDYAAVGSDGMPVAFVGAMRHVNPEVTVAGGAYVTHCDDAVCSSGETTQIGEGLGGDVRGADIAIGAGGLPLIAYSAADGLHLIRCPDLECTPP